MANQETYIKTTKGRAWSTGTEGEVSKTYGTTESNGFEYYYGDPPGSSRWLVEKPNCVELMQVKRKAEVGEHVVIVKKRYDGDEYNVGDVFKVEKVSERCAYSSKAISDYNDEGVILHEEYEVLVEAGVKAPDVPVPGEATVTPADMVESPPHYNAGKFEVIEIIEQITTGYEDPFVSYCAGNSIKYLARAPFKHEDSGLTDLKKARKYLDFAIDRIERLSE